MENYEELLKKAREALPKDTHKGERFEIPKVGSGFSSKKTFCTDCFKEILAQTKKDLSKIEDKIN